MLFAYWTQFLSDGYRKHLKLFFYFPLPSSQPPKPGYVHFAGWNRTRCIADNYSFSSGYAGLLSWMLMCADDRLRRAFHKDE